jgi:hypothetical protein
LIYRSSATFNGHEPARNEKVTGTG